MGLRIAVVVFTLLVSLAPSSATTAYAQTPTPCPASQDSCLPVTMIADPNPVPASAGPSSVTLSWAAPNRATVQIWVNRNGGVEQLMAQAGGSGSVTTGAWINAGSTYDFRLYDGTAHTVVLAQTRVTKTISSGSISANPNPTGSGGSTSISWDGMGNGDTSQVWVSRDGGGEVLMAQDPSGSVVASWIHPGKTYMFNLYAGDGHLSSAQLGSVTVTQ